MRTSDYLEINHQRNALCAQVVAQQAERDPTFSGPLRQRRRFLKKHLLKFIPNIHRNSMHYQNNGGVFSPANGVTIINPVANIVADRFSIPEFQDIDKDGDLGLFIGNREGLVIFYKTQRFSWTNLSRLIAVTVTRSRHLMQLVNL